MAQRQNRTRVSRTSMSALRHAFFLENLHATENLLRWKRLLDALKAFITRSTDLNIETYKFLGDGWILLYDGGVDGKAMLDFFWYLSEEFHEKYYKHVAPVLEIEIPIVGITFGVDKGSLYPMRMDGAREYVGRPLNIAARLQGAVSVNDDEPQYKVLMSNSVYYGFSEDSRIDIGTEFLVSDSRRTLRNVQGDVEYRCKKIELYEYE